MGRVAICRASLNSPNRGFALPILLAIVILAALSIIIMSSFGSATRNIVRLSEGELRCEFAVRSAFNEAIALMKAQLRKDPDSLSDFFKALLPPLAETAPTPFTIVPEATVVAFLPHIEVGEVSVSSIDRRISGGHVQGVLALTVQVEHKATGGERAKISVCERIRYVIERRAGGPLAVVLLPGRVGAEVKRR